MRRRKFLSSSLASAGVAIASRRSGAATTPGQAADSAAGPSAELRDLFAAEWDYEMEHDPVRASGLGDRRWNDRWPDESLAAIERDHSHRVAVLEKLKAIDRAALSPADRLNYDIFQENEFERHVEEYPFHWYLIPLNQREGIQNSDELGKELRFETEKDYEDWVARLKDFPAYMDQTTALMREGIKERMLLPKVVMERLPGQLDRHIVSDPTTSHFYDPFKDFPASIPAASRTALSAEAARAIAEGIVPAYSRFKEFFVAEYLPACPDPVGIWQLPRGEEMYAYFVRRYTTTKLTPAEVHAMGLAEVKRIDGEMGELIAKSGYKGSRAEFFNFLRTDPQFHYADPDQLLMAYRATAKRIDPHLVEVFRLLPRLPYGVEPIPAAVAPDTTAAYYRVPAADGSRAGTFMVNLYQPETRPKWEMMPLALHESVPGHHLQIALAMELKDLPNFRRYGYYEAFGEGWGLYAESLGEEMGLYDDPYTKFGELTYDMWRAVRLVVDTGMHVMRWDRQRAIDYFLEHAPRPKLDVTNEIDRYIAWPGQSLAYKIGQLKIKELRAKARLALGSHFDLHAFHEAVLANGSLPLTVLEQTLDGWLAAQRAGAA